MSEALKIAGGRVLDPGQGLDEVTDLWVGADGKIAGIGPQPEGLQCTQEIDATGLVVSPGFVDLHVHFREPGEEHKETVATGTASAAAGGFTTVCCMANTRPVNDQASVTARILDAVRETGRVNVKVVGALTRGLAGQELADLGELHEAGCVAFSDDGMPVMSAGVMRRGMEYARTIGAPVVTHAEDHTLSTGGCMHEGSASCVLGLPGIPGAAETVMVARDIELCELTGARLHIAHASCAGSIRMVADAKRRGLPVTCEVAPHHILLTDSDVGEYDTNKRMMPPLRERVDVDALIAGMADGTVDAVATDHAPHGPGQKDVVFEEAANGVVGLETALAALLALVRDGKLTLGRAVELLTSGPARTFSLSAGTLASGAAADIAIFDPDAPWKVDAAALKSKSRNSAFLGWNFHGKVRYTMVAGKVVYQA